MSHLKVTFRRDTSVVWRVHNPILLENELCRESDTGKWKIGDGKTPWNGLPYRTDIPETIVIRNGGYLK